MSSALPPVRPSSVDNSSSLRDEPAPASLQPDVKSGIGDDRSLPSPVAEAGYLSRTPLHALHLRLRAKMVPFAGYEMPLQYSSGLLQEHLHTRRAAGLFDVSHMGQLVVRPRDGAMRDAALALESLIPIDILGLPVGRQRYGFFTNDLGGIRDDLMVVNLGDQFLLVVNAGFKAADERLLLSHLSERCRIDVLPNALIALQGPGAEVALSSLVPDVASMRFMDAREVEIFGSRCIVTRSGYTGEDGFEVSIPTAGADALATALLADARVLPIGLGARDSLRLEAGLCLSGADIGADRTPVQAGLAWAIGAVRRLGGARAAGFPGASTILGEIEGGPLMRRVGLRTEGRAPVRAGSPLYADEAGGTLSGTVTSGGYGPTLGAPIAMGYLPHGLAAAGTRVFAEVRGDLRPMVVTQMPFVPNNFKRDKATI